VPGALLALAFVLPGGAAGCTYDYAGALQCTNGVRDGDEAGVDCGGSCGVSCDGGGGGATGGSGGANGSGGGKVEATWVELDVGVQPLSRYGHALAYHRAEQGSVVLFGGYEVGKAEAMTRAGDDTWKLERDTWTQLSPTTVPPERHYAGVAYDEVLERTVVAGGYSGGSLSDAYAWDGVDWKAVASLPSGQYGGGLVWDTAVDKLVLVAGSSSGELRNIFELDPVDGAPWKIKPVRGRSAPSKRRYFGVAYDRARERTVLFGGGTSDETWEYSGASETWTKMDVIGPSGRRSPAMAYDEDRHRVVLFGGRSGTDDVHNDTWEYDGNAWQLVEPGVQPPKGFEGKLVYDKAKRRMVLFGGADDNSNPLPAATWIYVALGTPCQDDSECGNGHCEDDVCCEYAECPPDKSCNTPESPGRCR